MRAYSQTSLERRPYREPHGAFRSSVPTTGDRTTADESHQFAIERGAGLGFTLTHVAIQINVSRHLRATPLQVGCSASPAQG